MLSDWRRRRRSRPRSVAAVASPGTRCRPAAGSGRSMRSSGSRCSWRCLRPSRAPSRSPSRCSSPSRSSAPARAPASPRRRRPRAGDIYATAPPFDATTHHELYVLVVLAAAAFCLAVAIAAGAGPWSRPRSNAAGWAGRRRDAVPEHRRDRSVLRHRRALAARGRGGERRPGLVRGTGALAAWPPPPRHRRRGERGRRPPRSTGRTGISSASRARSGPSR